MSSLGEITFIGEISTKLLCGPPCFQSILVQWFNSWYVHSSRSNMFTASRLNRGHLRNSKFCPRTSNKFCLFMEIYWSVADAISKRYWRVLNMILKISPISISSLICFNLTAGKMAIRTAHQRRLIKGQKLVEVPIHTWTYLFLSTYLDFISWPSPFNVFSVPEDFQVALKFQSFEIENHDNCVYDYLGKRS